MVVNEQQEEVNLEKIGFLHLIEHEFKITKFKKDLFTHCTTSNGSSQFSTLVIDVISEWNNLLENNKVMRAHYMNSTSILNMDGLINFLLQLNESPQEALKRCQRKDTLSKQLGGIIIDNITYLTHDTTSYNLLLRVLKMLRNTFGCWIMTISYGLEYYNGVENSTVHAHKSGLLTRLPMTYTNEMDAIIIRDTDSTARLCPRNV